MDRQLYFAAVVSIFFLLFSSPNLSGRSLDVYHTSTQMHVWSVLHAARWKYRTQKLRQNRPLRTIAQLYRQSEKNLLNGSISFICLYIMVNLGPLTAEICWRVWGTQQISTGFASWFRYCSDVAQRKPTKLHDVWPSPALVYYVCIFWTVAP